MKCKICNREALTKMQSDSKYCELHEKALQNILQKFEVWKKASGTEWEEYLKEIAKNPFTGTWAKEVAEEMLKERE